jgi:hypothetical protein
MVVWLVEVLWCTLSTRVSVPPSELGPSTRYPAGECGSPLGSKLGGDTLGWREGVGGPNSDEGTETLALYIFIQ